MTITTLGTGTSQGVPVIGCSCDACTSADDIDQRLRSSIHVQSDSTNLIIDIGPDFRQQMLRYHIDRIDAALITHEHNDHVIGLDDLRPFNFRQKMDIPVYSISRVLFELKNRFAYAFAEIKYPGAPRLIQEEIFFQEKFKIGDLNILPLLVQHGDLDVIGFRIKNFAYITDASHLPVETLNSLTDLDHLMINALRIEKHYAHYNLSESLAMIKKLAPRKAYLTHISHLMGMHRDWSDQLPLNVVSAYDGMVINC